MSKLRIIGVILVVVAAVAVGIIPSLLHFFAEQGMIKLKQRGLPVQVEGIAGFLVGVSATSAEGWISVPVNGAGIKALPLQISVENPSVALRPRLNPFKTSADFVGAAYGGELTASVASLFGSPTIRGSVQHLDLGLHPQLRALGLEHGLLQLLVTEHPLRLVWDSDASYSLELNGIELIPPSAVQQVSGISRLVNGSATVRATVKKGGSLSVDSCTFDSSLASGTLRATAAITQDGQFMNLTASVRINLDREDSQKLAAWLPILTNQGVSSEARSFVCNIRPAACGSAGAIRVGGDCLRTSCSA